MIRDVHPGSGTRIWILIYYPFRIPDTEVKKAPDPWSRRRKGTGSWVPYREPQHCTVIYVRKWTLARINTELWILHWAGLPYEQPGQPPAGGHPLEQHQSAAECLGEQQPPASAAGHGGRMQQDWPRPASPGRSLLALLLWSWKDP